MSACGGARIGGMPLAVHLAPERKGCVQQGIIGRKVHQAKCRSTVSSALRMIAWQDMQDPMHSVIDD